MSQKFAGKHAFVSGSSRGIGAQVAQLLAAEGATVAINYRDKVVRAEKIANQIIEAGGKAIVVGADLTDYPSIDALAAALKEQFGSLDLLVLNASGGMETGKGEDYAMRLNRDAQVNLVKTALPLLKPGSRIVFVTSHQAHFIRETPTMPEYLPVALSKRAGEDALRDLIPDFTEKGIEFVVVSGDMIEGTVTATLLDRLNPGAIDARKEAVGKLYNVEEFAEEIVKAASAEVPANNTVLIGDTAYFTKG
ncbi:MAG: dehydrogenase [Actinomycetota bacterium]|jgi:NAD(P)-dependent dehydrogenase (short-subunit alcohol dehydrogenase family)